MPYYCTVPRCTSMAGKAKNVSFHQFPRDEELANIWNVILKRGKPYTKYSKVCSLHFTPDDYTLNSVGQWRTLRKDAIPSQNLPSESPSHPPPRARGWLKDGEGSVDTQMHQQLAQAVYLQTMLAMQGSNCAQPHDSTSNTQTDRKQDHITSYKCEECSKCFKDPDVFVLHQRSHGKSQKENILINADLVKADTLSANPILANLLKSSAQGLPNVNILDPNSLLNVENQIMSALVANMENYVRNLSSLMANQSEKSEGGETVEDDDSDNDDNMVIDENYHSSFKDDDDDNKNSDIDCLKENSSVITQSECKIESEHINDIENGPSDNVKIENHISQLCNDDMSNNDYNTEDDQADSDKYDRKSDLKSLCNDHCLENDHSSNNEKHHQSDNNQTLSKNDDFISVNDIKSETSNDHDFENDHTSEINQTHINENDDLSSANDLNSRYSSNNHDFENFHTSHNISENLVYKGVQTPNCDRKDFNIEDTKQIV